MLNAESLTRRLLDHVNPYIGASRKPEGLSTPIPRLTVWTSGGATRPTPAVFEPMFYAVLRGTKVLTVGANRFELFAGTCAVSSYGLPYSYQFANATPGLPYVGISLHLDIAMLTRVMAAMPKLDHRWACAVAAADLNGLAGKAFGRLVGLLTTPDDVGMLATLYETELYYRLLQSPMGDTLRQIGERDDGLREIKAAADWLGANFSKSANVSQRAAAAGMSVTSFHRQFKAVTGYSPLAFQRHIRLLEARKLLAGGTANVSRIAYAVGYISPSQFSREYKSMFGNSPATDLPR